jgi:hypothetical protein
MTRMSFAQPPLQLHHHGDRSDPPGKVGSVDLISVSQLRPLHEAVLISISRMVLCLERFTAQGGTFSVTLVI